MFHSSWRTRSEPAFHSTPFLLIMKFPSVFPLLLRPCCTRPCFNLQASAVADDTQTSLLRTQILDKALRISTCSMMVCTKSTHNMHTNHLQHTQIVNESFLEDINNMLNSGEVPGMYSPEEKDKVCSDIREWLMNKGGSPTKVGGLEGFPPASLQAPVCREDWIGFTLPLCFYLIGTQYTACVVYECKSNHPS